MLKSLKYIRKISVIFNLNVWNSVWTRTYYRTANLIREIPDSYFISVPIKFLVCNRYMTFIFKWWWLMWYFYTSSICHVVKDFMDVYTILPTSFFFMYSETGFYASNNLKMRPRIRMQQKNMRIIVSPLSLLL